MDKEEKEMRVFFHKGRLHYSYSGHFISCDEYEYQKSLGKGRDTIMIEKAKSFKEVFEKDDRERDKKLKKIVIEDINQLMSFVSGLLKKEDKKEMKSKYKEGMTLDEKIMLFPGVYQNVLRLYQEFREHKEKGQKRALESLEKTLVRSYNPDAFLGE